MTSGEFHMAKDVYLNFQMGNKEALKTHTKVTQAITRILKKLDMESFYDAGSIAVTFTY